MKSQFHVLMLITALMVVAGVTAMAQEAHEQPLQELFQTRLVYPQERGEVQLAFSSRYGKGDGYSMFQTPFSLEYGVTDRWQVEIEWDAQRRRQEIGEPGSRGAGDFSIGTQYSFMNMAGSAFHSALGFEVTVPAANIQKELTAGFIEYEPYFIVARDFPRLNNMHVLAQAGIGFKQRARQINADEAEPQAHEFNLGVGTFIPFRQLVITGEFNLSTNRWNNGGREREMYATPGAVWRLPRNWEVGIGVPIGLTRDSDKLGAVVKVVYEFNLLGGSSQ